MTDRTVVYRIQADVAQAKAQVAALGASVRKSADDMTAGTKEGAKFRAGLDSLGGTAGKVGLVAAAGLGAAVLKAADFDQAMSNVQAATHESASAMDSLRQAALDAGAETAFSATEAAAGIENLAKAGVSTADILDGGLAGALSLAAAGEMEVADAAEAAAGAMAQFKLEGDQVPHVADLLAAAAGKAQGEVSDMVMALKQGGTVAAQTGLSLEETTGALAAMAEQSLLGSDAGTSFKTMLSSLTPNSDKAAKAMEQYNIHAFDAQGNFVGMTELAGQLRSGLGDLTDEQRAMALETIFGSDAVRAASIIYDNGAEGIAAWTEKVNDAGYAAETAAIKQDNLRGDLEKLGGAFETALIGAGSGTEGPLRSLVQSLESVVNAYNDLPDAGKGATAAIAGTVAVAGGGLWAFSKVVGGISSTRDAMSNLGITADSTKGKLKSAAAFVGGPWGMAFAGATILLGDYMAQQAKTEGYVDSLTAALDDQSGAMTRQAIATNLNEEGWLEYADSIGVSADTVIDAALGSADAMEILKAAAAEEDGFWNFGNGLTDDADQFIANVEAQTEAQKQAKKEAKLLAEANGETAESATEASTATEVLGGAMEEAAADAEAQAKALEEVRKRGAATAESFLGLGDSLNDGAKSLEEWMREMEAGADALVNFNANSKKAAKEGLDKGLILSLRDAGEQGALRMKQLANATDSEIARANKAWRKQQAEIERTADLTQRLAGLSPVAVKIDAETGAAMTGINNLEQRLRNIADEDVFINIRHRSDGRNTGFGPQLATGGPVYGPGTSTSDSIPAWLSTGEYVIQAAAVEQYGVGFFDSANAMRLAGGGSTDKKRPKRNVEHDDDATDAERAKREAREEERARQQEQADAREEQRRERLAQMEADRIEEAEKIAEAILDGQTRAWDQAADAAKANVDAAQAMVESVQGNMDRIGQAATSAFSGSWFSGGGEQQHGLSVGTNMTAAGDWRSKGEADIAGLTERSALITQLAGLGLDGAALEDLLANQSNAGISAMIGAGEIDDFEAMFTQRAALMESVGQQAGQAGYGADMAAANAELAKMNAQFASLTAAIEAARPITVLEAISAQATAQELARLMAAAGSA